MVSKPKQINGVKKQNKAWSVGAESDGNYADAATLFHNMDKAEMARKSHGMVAINGVSYSCSHFFAWGLKHRSDAVKLMEMVNG